MTGRVCVVTGANTGIGAATARTLAARGARVVLACRSEERARPVIDAIRATAGDDRVDFVRLDLGDLADVRRAARELLDRGHPIHVLVNNAGVAGQRGATRDGFELAFGVNHLGHFLWTSLLMDRLRASAPARVVNVSSKSHFDARGIDWDAVRRPTATFTGLREYAVSKLANVLFTAEFARRHRDAGVTAYALHPGVIATDVWRRVPWPARAAIKAFMKSPEQGARTTLYCASDPEVAGESGFYYDDCRRRSPSAVARDPALAAELWRRSAQWTGVA